MGELHSCSHKDGREISSRCICHGGTCSPIGMAIFSTCKKRYGIGIVGPEKVLQEKHLPCIFFGKYKTVPPIVGYLSTFAVKTSGIRLHNTMTSEKCEYKSLLRVIFELIGAVTGKRAFSTDDRIQEVKR